MEWLFLIIDQWREVTELLQMLGLWTAAFVAVIAMLCAAASCDRIPDSVTRNNHRERRG